MSQRHRIYQNHCLITHLMEKDYATTITWAVVFPPQGPPVKTSFQTLKIKKKSNFSLKYSIQRYRIRKSLNLRIFSIIEVSKVNQVSPHVNLSSK